MQKSIKIRGRGLGNMQALFNKWRIKTTAVLRLGHKIGSVSEPGT